ncbi:MULTISPECIES: chemotaxis protein CheB [unclassified Sphingomonas]|uniref:chemotaxis protein CheB n=1 Tax=unclassified Sphingomonas TaxID=196159 RepID=UPI00082FDB77|nr:MULTISPECIES: chemotaxis protein CheB [unclassified Sphingomonas]
MTAKKVLIVDDSMTMRALFTNALERSKDLVVVGAANGADEARDMIAELRPDVLTLDVEMPGMTGIEFLEELMTSRPVPVVMLSTLTQKGADVSLRAIELGAVDCFPKPARATPDEFEKIVGKLCKTVLTAASTNLAARRAQKAARPAAGPGTYHWDGSLVAIVGGMGGIEAASEMLAGFPANCPPTILMLAIDEGFGVPFAAKLSRSIAPKVKLAADHEPLEQGTVYIAVDPTRHVVIDRWPGGTMRLVDREPVNGCRPSADLLLGSIAKTAAGKCQAVILSGGGSDGRAGMAAVHGSGARCFGQSVETALVADAIIAASSACPLISVAPADLAAALTQASVVQNAA